MPIATDLEAIRARLAALESVVSAQQGGDALQPNYLQVIASGIVGPPIFPNATPGGALSPTFGRASTYAVPTLRDIISVMDFGARGDGIHDDSAAIASAIAALPTGDPNGGEIYFPPGHYLVTGINVSGLTNIGLIGAGGVAGGGGLGGTSTGASQIICAGGGAGSILNAQDTYGFRMENIEIYYTNPAFTGVVIDISSVSGVSVLPRLRNVGVSMGGANTARSATLLNLDNCLDGHFDGCRFMGGNFGATGKSVNANFCNANTFTSCVFIGNQTLHTKNLDGACLFQGCIFEPLYSAGAGGGPSGAGAIGYDVGIQSSGGVTFIGCWFGDSPNVGNQIAFTGSGLVVLGCFITGAGNLINLGPCTGVAILGNALGIAVNGISIGSQVAQAVIVGNSFAPTITNEPITGWGNAVSSLIQGINTGTDGNDGMSFWPGPWYLTTGSNKNGVATLTAGTATVLAGTAITATSQVYLTRQGTAGANAGAVYESARTAGTSFTIKSTNAADTGRVAWLIVEQA